MRVGGIEHPGREDADRVVRESTEEVFTGPIAFATSDR
jgi:hypothetical protein